MTSLPGLLGDIAEIAGATVALQIAQSHGGTRVSIPPRAEDNHWLTELVGFETANLICKGLATLDPDGRLKGIHSEIMPLGPASLLKNARRKALQALDDGKSVREAARLAGLHERTVWRMKSESDDEQGRLF
ncbi:MULTISPECIES: helix-turn-helix domain-containing protein [unclassified Rhizobium]|uniref:helix-turn-helix domain-containing protein n=1 Tax=unclassified Rhizobium TaxID=2613769 RepID=UPI00288AAC36|nr:MULTISPECIES: helix-turn-helix domain-containing protein [unclassified Rhizobium]